MAQDLQLNPELWQNLPTDLVDIIVKEVLIGLPFSRLLRFCLVFKRWRSFLLSTQYLLYFNNLDECTIFNPRTGLWESMQLVFSEQHAVKLQHMELVSCDKGLLYFASAARDELILYNPLSRRWSIRSVRAPIAGQLIADAERKVRKSFPFRWHVLKSAPQSVGTPIITLTIISHSNREYFKLHLTNQYRYGTQFMSLNLKDSRRGDWMTVPDVPRDFYFSVFLTVLFSTREIMLGFHRSYAGSFRVLLYHVSEQRCHWVRNVLSFPNLVTIRMRKALLATLTGGGELEFVEFVNGGVTLAKAAFPPPTVVLRNLNATFNFVQLIRGDIMYYIWLFKHLPEGQARGEVNMSVRTQNPVNGIERIYDWVEGRPSGLEYRQLPSSTNFHVFRPCLFPR